MIGTFHIVAFYLYGKLSKSKKVEHQIIIPLELHQVYVSCLNCILSEEGLSTSSIDDVKKGDVLVQLVDILWPQARLDQKIKESGEDTPEVKIETVLKYLTSIGVKHTITKEAILEGELKPTLEVLWLIFLHLCIHTPRLSAFQRNPKIGTRTVLNWCREKLPELTVNHMNTLVENLCRGCAIIDVLSAVVGVKHSPDTVQHLTNCLEAVQKDFGISKQIINPEKAVSCKIEEEILLIYIALLKRKVKQKESKQLCASANVPVVKPQTVILKDAPPTRLAWTM